MFSVFNRLNTSTIGSIREPPRLNGRDTRRSTELKSSLKRAVSETSGSLTPLIPPDALVAVRNAFNSAAV